MLAKTWLSLKVNSALELNGAAICVQQGTTTELNLADYFRANKMQLKTVTFATNNEAVKAYDAGRCDAYTTNASALYAERLRTVNPNDVENAAWHYLCVARAESPAAARAALLPVGPDARLPMRQVYDLFRGAATPEQVLSAAGTSAEGQFFGHLYLGLYFEAAGDRRRSRDHIAIAAEDRFRSLGGYMHAVARIHQQLRP